MRRRISPPLSQAIARSAGSAATTGALEATGAGSSDTSGLAFETTTEIEEVPAREPSASDARASMEWAPYEMARVSQEARYSPVAPSMVAGNGAAPPMLIAALVAA